MTVALKCLERAILLVRVWIALLMLPLAGCVAPQYALVDEVALEAAQPPSLESLWMVRSLGCVNCVETIDWATAVALYDDGTVHFFAYRPDDRPGTPEPEAGTEHQRAALAALEAVDTFHARAKYGPFMFDGDHMARIDGADWPAIRQVLASASKGLQSPPEIGDRGCLDGCGGAYIALAGRQVGGEVMVRTEGYGNVAPDSAWATLDAQLRVLHAAAARASAWKDWYDGSPPVLRVSFNGRDGVRRTGVPVGTNITIDASATEDDALLRVGLIYRDVGYTLFDGEWQEVVLVPEHEGLHQVRVLATSKDGHWVEVNYTFAANRYASLAWTPDGAVSPLIEPPPCGPGETLVGSGTPTRIVDIPVVATGAPWASVQVRASNTGPADGTLCLNGEPVGYKQSVRGGETGYLIEHGEAETLQFVVHAEQAGEEVIIQTAVDYNPGPFH